MNDEKFAEIRIFAGGLSKIGTLSIVRLKTRIWSSVHSLEIFFIEMYKWEYLFLLNQ